MPLLPKTIVPFYSLYFALSCNRSTVEVTDFMYPVRKDTRATTQLYGHNDEDREDV
jgi:hypothetical protein